MVQGDYVNFSIPLLYNVKCFLEFGLHFIKDNALQSQPFEPSIHIYLRQLQNWRSGGVFRKRKQLCVGPQLGRLSSESWAPALQTFRELGWSCTWESPRPFSSPEEQHLPGPLRWRCACPSCLALESRKPECILRILHAWHPVVALNN